MKRTGQATTRALADRKGTTALEYALIGAAIVPVIMAGVMAFYGRIDAVIGAILS